MAVFPKKGWRKVNGEWVEPPVVSPPAPTPQLQTNTASGRRNWLRKMAGWPTKG